MTVIKNPDIENLDPEGLCHQVYTQLYNQFYNAQEKKSETFPYGIEEGDELSIRLHNTAYGFAYAIAGAAMSGGGSGGVLLEYLQRSGGYMTGALYANNGFEAGIGNNRLLETFKEEGISGIRITGNLDVTSTGLYIGGKQVLSYIQETKTAFINSPNIQFGDACILSEGEITIGTKENGVFFSPDIALINNHPIYHTGNANRVDVNWQMKDGSVAGNLKVDGIVNVSGMLKAVNGAELGVDNVVRLCFDDDDILTNGFIAFGTGYGIKIKQIPVLIRSGENDIQLGSIGGDLLLGSDYTNKIKLVDNLTNFNGQTTLLTPYGGAYFPDSLTVHHNSGAKLFSSYRVDSMDEGMIIHKKLRFSSSSGSFLAGEESGVSLTSFVERIIPPAGTITTYTYKTAFTHGPSSSLFQPLNRDSDSMIINTDTDFFRFEKPVEAKNHVAIDNSFTRLTDGALFFTEGNYLLSVAGGIKYSGNAIFLSGLSSEHFASGFAGSGWDISRNETTGNITATFDELTIRKKMRIYEMEVQKISAVGGSLWVSDTCSGDQVIKL